MLELTVFVVDDDANARASVSALVSSMGLTAKPFASAEEFLAAYRADTPGCLVTDVRMFGMSGLELQSRLKAQGALLPVIMITAYPRTELTVKAVQEGAVTVLEKPYNDDDLWNAVRKAMSLDSSRRAEREYRSEVQGRLRTLTNKEYDVLSRMAEGKANKVIARELDISLRTVENRRHEVFEKMGATSLADLIRMLIRAGFDPCDEKQE